MELLADLSYLDAFIAVTTVVGLVRGWSQGLMDQVLSIVGIVVAIILSAIFAQEIGLLVVTSLDLSPRLAGTLGFAVTFTMVMLGVFLMVRTIKATLGAFSLGGVDKLFGAGFGGFKALLILSLGLAFLNVLPLLAGATTPVFSDEVREESAFYGSVRGLAPATWEAVRPVLPGLQERLFQAVDDLEAGLLEEEPTPTSTPPRNFGG